MQAWEENNVMWKYIQKMQILKESVGGSREKESRYGNKMEANRETTSAACKNITDTDIDLEPGPGGSDKNVVSKNQADSAT